MYARAGKRSRRRRAETVPGRSVCPIRYCSTASRRTVTSPLLNNFLIPAGSHCALWTGGFIIEAKSKKQNFLWNMSFISCERRGGNDEKKKAWTAQKEKNGLDQRGCSGGSRRTGDRCCYSGDSDAAGLRWNCGRCIRAGRCTGDRCWRTTGWC